MVETSMLLKAKMRPGKGSRRGRRRWFAVLSSALTLGALVSWALAAENATEPAFRRGVQLFHQHEFAQAAAVLRTDLEANPKDIEALIFLGRIAFEQSRLGEAAQYFERAIAIAPRQGSAYHWYGRVSGMQARELGVPRGIGAARRTRKSLEKAVELDPDNLEARVELATFYREAPSIVGGSTQGALAQLKEISRRDPYLGALIEGDLAMDAKKFREAQEHYQLALDREPNRAEAYFRMGVLHQKTGQFSLAFAAFEGMLKVDSDDKRAYFQIGKTADLSGQRLDQGVGALKTYLQCQPFFVMPKLSSAHRRLGGVYAKQGRRDAAREQYLAALALEPDNREAAAGLKALGK
jgi:tetratricopeptide (TPR) repeat protein